MSKLSVRAYNVHFGDAILVTVPDRDPHTNVETVRHILIDVGNVLSGDGGDDSVFAPAMKAILDEVGKKPIDLYVMTHEHLDHVQGLYHMATKGDPTHWKQRFRVDYAWLTASAHEKYYEQHPEARKEKKRLDAAFQRLRLAFEAREMSLRGSARERHRARFGPLLANNNPRKTEECVAYLRQIAQEKTTYVARESKLAGTHPFREAKFEILAPEKDTSAYYKGLWATAPEAARSNGTTHRPDPPAGVDATAFADLLDARERGFGDLFSIDKAANNTSVVFTLEWRGWKLLFPGDAEIKSWKTMRDQGVLAPVHFLKVSHHGSHIGSPDDAVLDLGMKPSASEKKKRKALISTWSDTYGGIPDEPTNAKLRERCTLKSMLDDKSKPYIEHVFEAP